MGRPAYCVNEPSLWTGCYDEGWQGEIVPEAFAHPAKVSRALIRRIYAHAFAEGWLRAGDVVADPFGGIAGTALDAMWNGCHWIGCELEPRFVGLAQQNIDLWQRKYGSKPGFGSARIVQGDSRKLSEIIACADLVCSSPPFLGNVEGHLGSHKFKDVEAFADHMLAQDAKNPRIHGRSKEALIASYERDKGKDYGQSPGQLGAMKEGEPPAIVISSPPFASQQTGGGIAAAVNGKSDYVVTTKRPTGNCGYQHQGDTAGQLGSMPEGQFSAVVSSPPYAAIATGAGGLNTKPGKDGQQSGRSPNSASQDTDQRYGESAGQLATMAEGDVAAVISSPPFEKGAEGAFKASKWKNPIDALNAGRGHGASDEARLRQLQRDEQKTYGNSEGQLGQETGDTFWQAAAEILAQCYSILRPGGRAIFICKDFVRKGKRVPFSDQWQALCEAQGFRLVCRHRAMLVAHHGEQDGLFGETKQLTTARKSFFRRLAEAKGSPAIDWEDILCLTKETQCSNP